MIKAANAFISKSLNALDPVKYGYLLNRFPRLVEGRQVAVHRCRQKAKAATERIRVKLERLSLSNQSGLKGWRAQAGVRVVIDVSALDDINASVCGHALQV